MDRPSPSSTLAQRTRDALARRPGRVAFAAAASLIAALAHAMIVVAAGMLARRSLGSSALDGGGGGHAIMSWAALGIAASAVKLVAGALAVHAESRLAADAACALRRDVLLAWLDGDRARAPRQADHGLAESVSPRDDSWATHALTGRVDAVERGITAGVFGALRAAFELAPLVVLLAVAGSRVAWVVVALLAPLGVVVAAMRRWSRRAAAVVTTHELELQESVERAVRHRALWTVYGASSRVAALLGRASERASRAATHFRVVATLASASNEVLAAAALLAALVAARSGWLGTIDGVSLIAFSAVFFLAYRPLRQLGDARAAWHRAAAAYEGVAALASRGASLHSATTGAPAPARWSSDVLVLEGVRSHHGAHAPVSLRVPPGSLVAVVGATGVGKSSLVACLLGLEPLREGRVRFGDADLTSQPAGLASRPFAWLPQHAPVLRGSLADNVAVGGPVESAPVASVLRAGRLPDESAEVGGGRRALSGGESQWLGLARAVASSAPVLVLDEPTAALDAQSQRALIDELVALTRSRTVIAVTHAPALIAAATHVVDLGLRSDRRSGAEGERPAPRRDQLRATTGPSTA